MRYGPSQLLPLLLFISTPSSLNLTATWLQLALVHLEHFSPLGPHEVLPWCKVRALCMYVCLIGLDVCVLILNHKARRFRVLPEFISGSQCNSCGRHQPKCWIRRGYEAPDHVPLEEHSGVVAE